MFQSRFSCAMTAEQERKYTRSLAERILRYGGILLFLIIAIQLYNLGYAYVYTDGTFASFSSRVYAGLYLSLIGISLAALLTVRRLRRDLERNAGRICRLQLAYGVLLMVWAACVTLFDQRVSENINVYLIVALTVAVMVSFQPVQAVAAYGGTTLALALLIPVFEGTPSDRYGRTVNLAIMALMAIFLCIYRYVSERRHFLALQTILDQNRRLNEDAKHDPLTRLRNRRFLEEEMDALYRRCAVGGQPLTLMMMDIDNFKSYNDTYGHPQGDECLRRTAWRLEQELDPAREYLIRYGGEEFLYIGLGVNADAAVEMGERLCRCVRELTIGPSENDKRSVTISVGVFTGFPRRDAKPEAWMHDLSQADKALYQAKNGGRNRCAVAFEPREEKPE